MGSTTSQMMFSELDIRTEKINQLKKQNVIVYKNKFIRSHTIEEAVKLPVGTNVRLAGRIISRRIFGKFGFCEIFDIKGKIQISVGRNEFDEEFYNFYKKMIDIADFIGVEGQLYLTQTGELTVRATKLELLSKAMRPLPEKFHGITDIEARYRQRYLDLIMNKDVRDLFLARSKACSFVRRFLEENDFIEIETPIIQKNVSGATAKPFFTKHNALNLQCNLRIATETWLKQAIAGGFDRVFELGKDFRNEGMDQTHLQEFTQVEWYAAYWDYEDNIQFFQKFIKQLLMECIGKTFVVCKGNVIDFGKEQWERINYVEEMTKIFGFDFLEIDDVQVLKNKIIDAKLFTKYDLEEFKSTRAIIDFVYKKKIRENIIGPTILYNYPAVLKTLARRNDKNTKITDAFQVVVCGAEILNAYSELVDPITQRKTLEEQLTNKNAGDDEAMDVDEDFLLAMEHGMPPISGLGFGIDRFIMMLFDCESIRDTILFPLMR
ncbi:MAG: lysine--tRNA ligase [Clostridia bacterium]